MKVVGTGLGRTGTKSMQTALNMLGVGPCHHMYEVFAHPESMALWVEAGKGKPQWDLIFRDYQSVVDYPGAAFWREISAHYPDAKVLHTVRDPDKWFESTQATIFAPGSPVFSDGPHAEFFRTVIAPFHDHIHDREFMTAYFRKHTQEVLESIDPKRLLVFEVGEGWNRLCAFLGVPVPTEPYPSENSREAFAANAAKAREGHD